MMVSYLALLRAVNVSGKKILRMETLREFATDLGFENVQTFIQSGNLIFQCKARPTPALEKQLEVESEKVLGLQTDFIVRSCDELRKAIERNPLPEATTREGNRVLVVFLKNSIKGIGELAEFTGESEILRGTERELYLFCPKGFHESRLTLSLIERKLGVRATGRNWNTVRKLAQRIEAISADT